MFTYEKPDNLVEWFSQSVAAHGKNPLFGTKNASGSYEWVNYEDVGKRVDHLRGGLAGLGVGRNDAVGIIANNRTEWAVAAFATFGLGARFVPMYEKELPMTWKYIINNSGAKVLLAANKTIFNQVAAMKDDMPGLEKIFVIDDHGDLTMETLERQGKSHPIKPYSPDPGDVAVLIYTSGTTGQPKGVLLTHGNFTSNARSGYRFFADKLGSQSRSLSILPWAHSYAQTAELYNFIQFGGSIGFAESADTVADDMKKVRPTFLIAVPMVFNRIYDKIHSKMNEDKGLGSKLFFMGLDCAHKKRRSGSAGAGLLTELKYKIADAIVFKKIRSLFGGRLEGALTASATMNPVISNFFWDIGIPVYDCYGLTETSPAITMSCPTAYKIGSVGRCLDNVTVKIDSSVVEPGSNDGEIVVYGPNIMQGYHNNPEATQKVMTENGGFRTGDRGYLDEDGYLCITGRIKEQYKLENGKYIFPVGIEEEIRLLPWVENAMIFGDSRSYNVCLIIPDFTVLNRWAGSEKRSEDPDDLVKSPEANEMIFDAVNEFLTGKFGSYEIPKKITLIKENFSLENGLLTQTMKLKRRKVIEKYQSEIDRMYQ